MGDDESKPVPRFFGCSSPTEASVLHACDVSPQPSSDESLTDRYLSGSLSEDSGRGTQTPVIDVTLQSSLVFLYFSPSA